MDNSETDRTVVDASEYDAGSDSGEDVRIGPYLSDIREDQGLAIADLSKELRIAERYLSAIESMQIGPIPKGYLTVFLRAYAGRLGLDAGDIVERYTKQCGAVSEVAKSKPVPALDKPEKRRAWPMAAGAALLLGVVAAGVFAYSSMTPDRESATVIAAAAPVNGARDSLFDEAPARVAAPEALPLTVTAVRQGWIEVRGSDGTIFRSRVMAAGEVYHPRIGAGWTISARDGGAFEWRVGDVSVGALGPDGAPAYALSVDAKAAEAAETASPALAATPGETTPR